MFEVPIGNSKCVEEMKFHSNAPMLKYCQNSWNSFFLGSLDSAFDGINQSKNENYIAMRIEESLTSQLGDCIDFTNTIFFKHG